MLHPPQTVGSTSRAQSHFWIQCWVDISKQNVGWIKILQNIYPSHDMWRRNETIFLHFYILSKIKHIFVKFIFFFKYMKRFHFCISSRKKKNVFVKYGESTLTLPYYFSAFCPKKKKKKLSYFLSYYLCLFSIYFFMYMCSWRPYCKLIAVLKWRISHLAIASKTIKAGKITFLKRIHSFCHRCICSKEIH